MALAAAIENNSNASSSFFDSLNKGTLNIADDIQGITGNVQALDKGFAKLNTTWSSNISSVSKLTGSVGALASVGINAAFAIGNIQSAITKLGSAKVIIDAAYNSVKNFVGVSKAIDFSEAILGTKEFSQNIKTLEETADTFFNKVGTGLQIVFDNQTYQKWSIGAVAAYSKVESAAFKLATITTSSEQSALSAIGERVKAMRELQQATNFATNSVQTLNAQYDIASGGFDTKTAQKSVGKASINLSEIGFANVEGTNQGIVKILAANKSVGDTYRDAEKRAAQLFATTKVGILTLDQLNAEAAELASTGVGAGVAFEEMATALALVTTQGLSAAEGSTAIKALVNEVVSNIPKAQSALATLRDEAGQPIQFGFGALKEEGLIKIIERIGKATGGSRDALNNIFSSKEAAAAANALLQAGGDARSKFRAEIEGAGSTEGIDKFTKSSEERAKTLEGAFRSSFNKSQAAVEDFGSGVSENVKKNLEDTNTLLGVLAQRSSSSFGSFAGTLDGFASKFQSVAGFIGSVFSVIAPLAFFSFLFKNLGRLGQEVKKALNLNEGEVSAKNIGEKIENAIVRIAKNIITRVKDIVARVNKEIGKVGEGNAQATINAPTRPTTPIAVTPPRNVGFAGGISQTINSTSGAIGRFVEFSKPLRAVIGGAARELFSFAGSMGLVGGAVAIGSTLLTGLGTVLTATANKANIPEIKELAENLKDVKGVEGLDKFVDSLTDARIQAKGLSNETNILLEGLDNLKQTFNFFSGKAFTSGITQDAIKQANSLLESQISRNQQSIKNRNFNPQNEEERTVQRKIQLGIVLNEEDLQVIRKKADDQVNQIEKQISNIDIAIKDAQDSGGFGARELVLDLKEQKKLLEDQAKIKKENIRTDEKRAILENQLRRLQTFKSDIPISISTANSFRSSSEAQFKELKKTLDTVFTVDKIDLSNVDISEFSKIAPQLRGVLESVEVQANIDPEGAIESLQRLTKDVRVMQFVASDPTAQKALDDAFKVATDKVLGYNNAVNNSFSKLFSTISSAGAVGGEAISQATKKNLDAISKNIQSLRASLDSPNISAQDYANTLSKIADLSAEAFNVKNAGQIAEELGKRKQLLTFNQGLLDVQKNIVSLFSQESKFGSLSVSLAQAKLAAAEKELTVKKESIAIAAREEEITKTNILEAAQAELKNRENLLQKVLTSAKISPEQSKTRFGTDQAVDLTNEKDIANKKAEANKQIQLSKEQLANSERLKSQGLVSIDKETSKTLKESLFEAEKRAAFNNPRSGNSISAQERFAEKKTEEKFSRLVTTNSEGTFLNTNQVRALNSEAAFETYIKAIEGVKNREKKFKDDIRNSEENRNNITGSGNLIKERVSNIDIEGAKKVVKQAEEDLNFTQVANKLKQEVGALAETIARNEAAIDASFANQQRLIDISRGTAESLSNLGSTASSLFSASSLGATFGRIGANLSGKFEQVFLDANKEIAKVTSRLNTIQQTRDKVAATNEEAKKKGVSSPDLQKAQRDLEKQLATAKKEADRDLQYVRQKTILDGVNASLERFGAIAKEGADKLDKVANLANARIDLQSRREQSTVQSNQANRGFTNSLLGLLGQNNPAAQTLIARNEILGDLDKIQSDKNEAGRAGEKELNTLKVQEQQLLTENLMLTNALTQTQLLGKLVEKISPESGVNVGDIKGVNQVIGNIPKNISDATAQTNKALELNQETQGFVRQDTFSKIRNIDLEGRSQILNKVSSNPLGLAGSGDILAGVVSGGLNLVKQQPTQQVVARTPFGDDFNKTQSELQNIGGNTRSLIQEQTRVESEQLRRESTKISNNVTAASPNKPQNPNSQTGQQNLSVVVNNTISLDGVKTSVNGDNLNKVGAAVGVNGDVIGKRLQEFGTAFAKMSREVFSQ